MVKGAAVACLVSAIPIAQSVTHAAEPCSTQCLVEIEQLRSVYQSGATVEAVIRNASTRDVAVNVALDTFVESKWREVLASISDEDHPLGKAVRMTRVPANGETRVAFPACFQVVRLSTPPRVGFGERVVPCDTDLSRHASSQVTYRLRAQVVARDRKQEVFSPSFVVAKMPAHSP